MRYCPKCNKDFDSTEVDSAGFHRACGFRTVPLWSEERRRILRAEERIKELEAENDRMRGCAGCRDCDIATCEQALKGGD